jgi:hypothetical protein
MSVKSFTPFKTSVKDEIGGTYLQTGMMLRSHHTADYDQVSTDNIAMANLISKWGNKKEDSGRGLTSLPNEVNRT